MRFLVIGKVNERREMGKGGKGKGRGKEGRGGERGEGATLSPRYLSIVDTTDCKSKHLQLNVRAYFHVRTV